MSDIFLSYRLGDDPGYVARLADGLTAAFGDVVFRDVDSIHAGTKWKLLLQKQVSQVQVVIAVIGKRWQSILSERGSEADWVRFELNLAHALEIPVIPVRMQEAPFDLTQDLGDLNWLRELQFFELSDRQGRWATDLDQLILCIIRSTSLRHSNEGDKLQSGKAAQPAESDRNALRQASGKRSITIGGNADRIVAVTGDHNQVSQTFKQTSSAPPDTVEPDAVDIAAELSGLRMALSELSTPDSRKIENAMSDAEDELARPEPDKDEIGKALGRAITYAQKAEGFSGAVEELFPRVAKIAGWLGSAGIGLSKTFGLTA